MRLLSPRELADALGVSESSLKRWVDAGKISATRTDGGHRRIALAEAVRFIRETGAPLAHPEILDMPEVAIAHGRALHGDSLLHYLEEGDAVGARGWLLARYLAGAAIAELCDGPVRESMQALGELWRHDEGGVFVEHRGTDVCLQALAHLRATFDPPAGAPLALGATPEDDPYLLASFMAALVVGAAGMRAVNLGPDTPVSALHQAVLHYQPRLVWISASAPLPAQRARSIAQWIATLPPTTCAVVGGRESAAIVAAHHGVQRFESMAELAELASQIAREAAPVAATP
ncbi:MAG: excisionase family DNA-binding protein [Deltaproteobacteria bacterium]|nr:excisionase family DNA-binding protein [Deltaproteobacteria bacterium]